MAEWKAGTGQKVERLYAWIATEPDGGEGVLGLEVPSLGWVMMAGADRARIESYRGHACEVSRSMGLPVKLMLFGPGVVVDTIEVRKT